MMSILLQAIIVGYFAGGIANEEVRILYVITTAICTFVAGIVVETSPHGK